MVEMDIVVAEDTKWISIVRSRYVAMLYDLEGHLFHHLGGSAVVNRHVLGPVATAFHEES